MTPGVQRVSGGDALGQQYNSVEQCVERGADVLIVGRGIYGKKGDEVDSEAKWYREAGWAAYLKRVGQTQ